MKFKLGCDEIDELVLIGHRGSDTFIANREQIKVDVTDFSKVGVYR